MHELFWGTFYGGDDRGRTGHLLHAKQSLYQLSYIPTLIGIGADDGNRTRVSSLGSYSSTIELHPQEGGFL